MMRVACVCSVVYSTAWLCARVGVFVYVGVFLCMKTGGRLKIGFKLEYSS